MKKIVLLLASLFLTAAFADAQDVITKKNGERVQSKVVEVADEVIKYKRFDNPDGPLYTISKADVLLIDYENGRTDSFSTYIQDKLIYKDARPGMSYKEIKNAYNPKEYVRKGNDPYNPGVAGVCSFLIPGLGQLLNGEVGRGFGNLLGSSALIGAGYGIASAAVAESGGNGEIDSSASLACIACFVGAAVLEITSITGAIKMAKVKNMYNQDMNAMQAKADVRFTPSFSYHDFAQGSRFCPGIKMTVSF